MNSKNWQAFKTKLGVTEELLESGIGGIQNDFNVSLPTDLLELLQLNNGQKKDTTPLFCWSNYSSIGQNAFEFNFLDIKAIRETYYFIQQTTKLDAALVPFAKLNRTLGDSGSMAFTINANDNSIHLTKFYEYDRFNTVHEHGTMKIAKSLDDFINSQADLIELLDRKNTSH